MMGIQYVTRAARYSRALGPRKYIGTYASTPPRCPTLTESSERASPSPTFFGFYTVWPSNAFATPMIQLLLFGVRGAVPFG